MKITSDNPELLEDLNHRFELAGIVAHPIKVPSKRTKKGILEDIVQLIIENPEVSQQVIETVLDELTSLYNQEHIYIETKEGKIPYAEYKKMSSDEKSEKVFKV